MDIESTFLKDVYVINPKVNLDERGFFVETYRADLFKEVGIEDFFVQDNHSLSVKKNTIRGLYFQFDKPMAKLMRVTKGSAFLVAVDIRKDSPTFGQWIGLEASADNKKQLYAPAGFARGFQTLEDMTEVQYKVSAFYNPDGQGEILWNDKDIDINWPIKEEPVISDKNKNAPAFKEWCNNPKSDLFKVNT
ncbi:MAG: dTDP-4-dehydrorhamnose 3,5-epimerase [Candidatus Vogelbacteria bacterium]|nr:dTDP-4-dehydrorhamnose 3,5-epimerase [Candidatus Vogelbacteria bacterium]